MSKHISGTYSNLPFSGEIVDPLYFAPNRPHIELDEEKPDHRLPAHRGTFPGEDRTKHYLSLPSNWQDCRNIVVNE